jgi:adenine-specific DNA-methyltransferase
VGKENRPQLEPRILLEDAALSYHAPHLVGENDVFDNRLIFGDNLLALKALEEEFAGKVKCVFIDPPYNTGSAFEHYDDGVEHSIWLSLIRDQLEIIRQLLADDGSLWIKIDDNKSHYLKVVLDEIFGRNGFIANIVWQMKAILVGLAVMMAGWSAHPAWGNLLPEKVAEIGPKNEKQDKRWHQRRGY